MTTIGAEPQPSNSTTVTWRNAGPIAGAGGAGAAEDAVRWHRPLLIWAGPLVESTLALAAGDVAGADGAAQEGRRRSRDLGVADAVEVYGVHLLVPHWLRGTADQLVDLSSRPPCTRWGRPSP